ncbi:MarR family winged helix-turn-helix transcriptional regulator [Cryptosporangium phraense]|uniref:MarR family transcriptional regulator n=1 Tax=Cryptosporangium phraense TaxID=2593070 RepID=A0A545AFY3_9ACTN|nr:MarR family transcriptional regulator [Cryptosporangium phraense]TQS40229.1 MarR family transcriptional regulator [Cryptosporangium phraense]
MTGSPSPWLDADQQRSWLRLAGLMIKLPAALDAQLQRDAGISHFDYMVLSRLSEAPDRVLRMSQLAEFANGSLSRLSHVVKRLEQRGWVERRPCPEDGRATNAVLTEAGWEKVVATAPGHVATVRSLVVEPLTTEQLEEFGDLVGVLLSQVDPEWGSPGSLSGGGC